MAGLSEVVIIAGCRTPIGKFQGSLSDMTATQIGAVAVREASSARTCNRSKSTSASWATSSLPDSVKIRRGSGTVRRTRSRSRCHDN